ncbi:MAG TPA: RNA polymerase sigma factor [Clostridia bacterium]|nr:RNA polymerase sigma factor [Clostridia bacterium]
MRSKKSIGEGSVGVGGAVYDKVVGYLTENQEKFYRLAYSYAHNKQDALDIVQSAIVTALEKYPSIRRPEYIRTWFYRVLVNRCLSHLASRRGEVLDGGEEFREIPAPDGPDPGDDLYQVIDRLPVEMKTAIILRFYEDMTLKDIARITDTNLSTAKYRLYAGLDRLKQILKEDDL